MNFLVNLSLYLVEWFKILSGFISGNGGVTEKRQVLLVVESTWWYCVVVICFFLPRANPLSLPLLCVCVRVCVCVCARVCTSRCQLILVEFWLTLGFIVNRPNYLSSKIPRSIIFFLLPKNWCFWTVMLEKTLESPLDCKEMQPVYSEGDQPWDFFGRNDAEAETPILWPPHEKSWLIGKDSDAGRDWGQEEKGTTEDEVAGWYLWLDGPESEWTPGVGDGQGGLACCNSWGQKESDTTEWLNWTELIL